MLIENNIQVAADPDELFEALLDVERVAPCMPGAALEKKRGEAYEGTMSVRVGPVKATYRGEVQFIDVDRRERRVTLKGLGRETKGQGTAEATIESSVTGRSGTAHIALKTDLRIRGKVAQFGRGVIEDVSQNIIQQFANNLEHELLHDQLESSPTGTASIVDRTAIAAKSPRPAATDQQLDLLPALAGPTFKRILPAAIAVAVLIWIARQLRRRSR